METKIWKADKNVDNLMSYPQIQQAAELLKKDEVIAFPTETVYGLGANAKSDRAVKKIFEAKGRPSDNPLIIHVSKPQDVELYAEEVPEKAKILMETFWPGPLTIILKKKEGELSTLATANLKTVGIRMPKNEIALALIEQSGLPIAAPSANLSGKPSPTKFEHVYTDMAGKIAGIVDGGETGVGVESTVLDCTEEIPVILRPGGVTKEELEKVIGEVRLDPALIEETEKPKSPGMKYKHYAPKAPMYIVQGSQAFLQQMVDKFQQEGNRVGVLTTDEAKDFYRADVILSCGTRTNLETIAHNLYDALRTFDETAVDVILSEAFPNTGIGSAIMNRMMKAASHKVIEEKI